VAEPKQKSTRRGRYFRREKSKLSSPTLSICPKCKSPKIAHQVCPTCGQYKGKEFIEPEKPKKKISVRRK